MAAPAQQRLAVLHAATPGQVRTAAAALLGVTERHVRRLAAACQQAGLAAVRHGHTGRPPAQTIPPQVGARVVALAQTRYRGCNHQQLAELLAERAGSVVSRSSVRRLLRAAGGASPRARPAGGHAGAARRQPARLAGGARPPLTLVAAIAAATTEVPAALCRAPEDAHGYGLRLHRLVLARGGPVARDHDRQTSSPPPPKQAWSPEEQWAGRQEPPQVGRLRAG